MMCRGKSATKEVPQIAIQALDVALKHTALFSPVSMLVGRINVFNIDAQRKQSLGNGAEVSQYIGKVAPRLREERNAKRGGFCDVQRSGAPWGFCVVVLVAGLGGGGAKACVLVLMKSGSFGMLGRVKGR